LVLLEANPQIDLILLDLRLPMMDGYTFLKEVRKTNPKLPVIAETAFAMANDRELILASGCNDYLAKPIDPFCMFKCLEKYLG